MIWNPTSKLLPQTGQVVLGWWYATTINTVVYRGYGEWYRPGYRVAERLSEPRFWADLPAPPDEQERAA